MDNVKLAKNIKALIKYKKMNIGQFEKEIGMTVGAISRNKRLHYDTLYIIAKRLGVSMESLIEKDYVTRFRVIELTRDIENKNAELKRLKGGGNE